MNETESFITTSVVELNDRQPDHDTVVTESTAPARTISPDNQGTVANNDEGSSLQLLISMLRNPGWMLLNLLAGTWWGGAETTHVPSGETGCTAPRDLVQIDEATISTVGHSSSKYRKDDKSSKASSTRPDNCPGPSSEKSASLDQGSKQSFEMVSGKQPAAVLTGEEKFDQERRRLWDKLDQQLREKGLIDPEVALSYNEIASLLLEERRLEEAMELLNQRLEIEKKVFQCDDDPKMAETYYNIARVLQQQGKYDAAKQQYEKALGIFLKVYGLVHSATATAYHAIGTVLRDQGKYKEANLQFARALVVQLEALGPGHSLTVKTNLGIANVWRDQGMYEEAMGEYQAVLTTLGRNHPYAASTYHCMGILLRNRGKFIDAMDQCQKALGITLKTLGPNHTKTALLYQEIGEVLLHQGRHEEASHRFQQALAICRQNLGDNHPRVAMIYNSIAKDLVHSRGDQEAALDLLSKAAEIQLMNSREDHPDLAKIYITMADALKNQSKFRDAAKLYNKALAIRIKVFGKENRFVEEVFLKKFKLSSGRVPILGLVQNFELVRPDDNIARNDE
mmetsp:Transcript_34986/g.84694  ORF Transcript_34986/g.84694 Transcript_34986/m.84694 type:complete len:567 (+) Transcript_34986:153-1853(+)